MDLRDKSIILISSERWGDIFISKHNYAIALAKRGNKVFFLNPIDSSLRPGEVRLDESGVHPSLKIITYRPWFPMWFKFHLRSLFEVLIGSSIKRMIAGLTIQPDIVLDFNCAYLYNDLSIFGAPLNIFFPVDMLATNARDKKADMIVSISDLILDQYHPKNVPRLKLNHGLGEAFVAEAESPSLNGNHEKLRVGYIGNLAMDALDRDIFFRLIEENPDISFNIIGPTSGKDNNLGVRGADDHIMTFVMKLKEHKNVMLHGAKRQSEIPALLNSFDILLLCYRRTDSFKCDNSHKMIEYLSSGKVVVCTYLSAYEGSELVQMSKEGRNDELPSLFKAVVKNIDIHNGETMQRKRREFALTNTYEKHISRIGSFISEAGIK